MLNAAFTHSKHTDIIFTHRRHLIACTSKLFEFTEIISDKFELVKFFFHCQKTECMAGWQYI